MLINNKNKNFSKKNYKRDQTESLDLKSTARKKNSLEHSMEHLNWQKKSVEFKARSAEII